MIRSTLLAASLSLIGPASAQTAAPAAGGAIPAADAADATARPDRPPRKARKLGPTRRRPPLVRVQSANRAATREPERLGFVNAVQVYPWSEGALYRLYAAPERVTDVTLQPGETLTAVAAGDTARWTIGDTSSGTGPDRRVHLLIKPFAAGLTTNLIITTDRRSYHLQLESSGATAMAAVSFTYAADELLAIRREAAAAEAARPIASGLRLESLNFGYRIEGDRPAWRPLRAFDDGHQTFIAFPASMPQGEAPPLFVTGDRGETELVNYRVQGSYYVVDRLFGSAELRLGARKQQVVRIVRDGDAPVGRHGGRKS